MALGHEAPHLDNHTPPSEDEGTLFADAANAANAKPEEIPYQYRTPPKALAEIERTKARREDPRLQARIDNAEQQTGGQYAAERSVLGADATIEPPEKPQKPRTIKIDRSKLSSGGKMIADQAPESERVSKLSGQLEVEEKAVQLKSIEAAKRELGWKE